MKNVTTKDGLLWQYGKVVNLPKADAVARAYGFNYAETMVKHLESVIASKTYTLNLTIKKKWFDMIASGEKTEEYREVKQYWHTRLAGRHFDSVLFRNGYHKDAPFMLFELTKPILSGFGRPAWGATKGIPVFIIELGRRLQ